MSTYTMQVKDFQIIKDASIEFHQGLTLIQGLSNHGKSSLFKAFRQLLYNTSGTDYIRHTAQRSLITLKYDDVYYIEYYKSKTKSQYTITTPSGTEVYSKLGSSQLDQIKSITHIDKDLDYNFWYQMDKPFLISQSPKEQFDILQNSPHSITLSNCLLQMSNDRKNYQKQEIQKQSQLELLQNQNVQFQNDIQKLPAITQLFTQLDTLKERNINIKDLSLKVGRLNQLSTETTQLQSHISKLHQLPSLDTLNQLHTNITQLSQKLQTLKQTVYPINDLQNQINNTKTEYDRTKLFIDQYFPNCPLCNQPFHTHQ